MAILPVECAHECRKRRPRARSSGAWHVEDGRRPCAILRDQSATARCPGRLRRRSVTPSEARQRTVSSQRTGLDTWRNQRVDGSGGGGARLARRRWRSPAPADRVARDRAQLRRQPVARPAPSARSGTARSRCSGITRLAPSALAHSPARATAAACAGNHDLPGAIQVGRADHLALRGLRACLRAPPASSRPRIAAIAPVAHRHGVLHVAATVPDEADGVGEVERAGRDVRRVLAQAVAGDEGRPQPALGRAPATRRCWR